MAVDLSSRAGVDVAKANLADVYGNAARLIEGRVGGIHELYNEIAAQIQANASQRAASDSSQARAQQGGMNSAAATLGLTAPPPSARTTAMRDVNREMYEGGAGSWNRFLNENRDITAGRNQAGAHAFDYMGSKARDELENQFLLNIQRGSGGGGGGGGRGGRGGGGGSDEGLVEYPSKVAQMTPGAARGLAATRLRLEAQANGIPGKTAAMPRDYRYNPTGHVAPKGPLKLASPRNSLFYK